jgi:hypothetical protein
MPRRLTFIALLSMLALGGCASSLSESQCLANDWETIGYRDGLSGSDGSSALMRHMDACVKHGVTPDRNAYLAGWEDGVDQYCQPANGFNLGRRGSGYSNVCPARLQSAFHAAYHDGRRLWEARSEVNQVAGAIADRERRLDEIKAEMAAITGAMLEAEWTIADRAQMLITAKDLGEEQGRLGSEIEELEVELEVKRARLDDLRQTLAFAGR